MVAGGTGITPMYQIIRTVLANPEVTPFTSSFETNSPLNMRTKLSSGYCMLTAQKATSYSERLTSRMVPTLTLPLHGPGTNPGPKTLQYHT